MKTTTVYHENFWNRPSVPLPNAATHRQVMEKLLDIALVAAIGAGIAASVLFLLALG